MPLSVYSNRLMTFSHSLKPNTEEEIKNGFKVTEYESIEKDYRKDSTGRSFIYHLYTIWLFTQSDMKTIISTQTAAGILSALAGPLMTANFTPELSQVLSRTPLVVCWNWLNLIVCTIANQRLSNSVLEDSVNKPWRPLPSGRLSQNEARRCLLIVIPCSLTLLYNLGSFKESIAIVILTWMYNDLGGADENYIVRNLLNACGLMCFASGSTLIVAGLDFDLTSKGKSWVGIIGAVVFSTVQMQDLEDMEGDKKRGRRTLPLVHGDWVGRLSVAIPVALWSVVCPFFWDLDSVFYFPTCLVGGCISMRVLMTRTVDSDKKTWRLWCLWIILIYLLPLLNDYSVFVRFWTNVGG